MAQTIEKQIKLRDLDELLVSLGFSEIPATLLQRVRIEVIAEQGKDQRDGILDRKMLLRLFGSPEFGEFLDYTFTKHNSTYNLRVIRIALDLWLSGSVQLDDFRALRTSFASYEAECSGIEKSEKAATSVLRGAGKAVARKRIQEWLSSVRESVAGRIQLYEVLELLPGSVPRDIAQKERDGQEPANLKRDKDGLFALASPGFLQSPEMKELGRLDEAFDRAADEAERKRAEEDKKVGVSAAAAAEGDQSTSSQETVAPLAEKLHRYDQLKETIRETNTRVMAARGSASIPPGATGPGADDGATQRAKVRVKSPIPHHKSSSTISGPSGPRVQSSNPGGGAAAGESNPVWDELRSKPETRDVAKEEAAFAPPRTWPGGTAIKQPDH